MKSIQIDIKSIQIDIKSIQIDIKSIQIAWEDKFSDFGEIARELPGTTYKVKNPCNLWANIGHSDHQGLYLITKCSQTYASYRINKWNWFLIVSESLVLPFIICHYLQGGWGVCILARVLHLCQVLDVMGTGWTWYFHRSN